MHGLVGDPLLRRPGLPEHLVFRLVLEHLHAVRFNPRFVIDPLGPHGNLAYFLLFDPLADLHGNLIHHPLCHRPANRDRHLADLLVVFHAEHFLRNPLRHHFILITHHLYGHLLDDRASDVLGDGHLLSDNIGHVLLLHLVGAGRLRRNPMQAAATPYRQTGRRLWIVSAG